MFLLKKKDQMASLPPNLRVRDSLRVYTQGTSEVRMRVA